MDVTEQRLVEGEWVHVVSRTKEVFTGYILKYDYTDDEYRVKLTRDGKGRSMNKALWLDAEQLLPFNVEIDEDILLSLIDIALDTKDEEWFLELAVQLPEELPFY